MKKGEIIGHTIIGIIILGVIKEIILSRIKYGV